MSPSRFCERAACVSHPSGGGLLRPHEGTGEGNMVLVVMQAQWSDDRGPPVAPRPLQATGKGEHPMHTLRRMPWLIALSLVVRLMPIELAVSAPAEPASRGASALRHDTATAPPLQEQDGPLLLLRVRALVPDKVTLSDPAQRTVRATVLAIDAESQPGQGPDGRGATARAVPPARDPGAPAARHAMPAPGRPGVDAGRRTSTSAGGALLVRHLARVRLRGVRRPGPRRRDAGRLLASS